MKYTLHLPLPLLPLKKKKSKYQRKMRSIFIVEFYKNLNKKKELNKNKILVNFNQFISICQYCF